MNFSFSLAYTGALVVRSNGVLVIFFPLLCHQEPNKKLEKISSLEHIVQLWHSFFFGGGGGGGER